MIDSITKKPLHVTAAGTASPLIMAPFSQLDEIRQLLDKHSIQYSVDENVISLNDEPETAFINLAREADVPLIQAILDDIR